MNQESCSGSITSPHDSCCRILAGKKQQHNTVAATPCWTDVPSCAFLVRKPIPRKPIIAAKFGNFPAGAVRMVSTDLHKGRAYSMEDNSSLVLGLSSNTEELPQIEREAMLETGSQPTPNPETSATGKLAIKCTPTRTEGSASKIISQISNKFPSGAIKVFSLKPVDADSSTPQVQSSEHASSTPMLGKCFRQTSEDLEVMETDATTVGRQSVISTGDTMREECVSKQVASEEEDGASEEKDRASEEEDGASEEKDRASEEEGGASEEEGGASGEDEERDGTLLPMDTDVENALLKTEPKDDKLIAEHQLFEEYDPNFLFTMDVEGLLIENQHKRISRKRKKWPDNSSPTLAPGGSVVYFKKWGHKRLKKVASREKRKTESSKSENKSDSTKRSKKAFPNAFVSIRIPSSEIRDKLQEIQEAMVAHNKKLQSTLVSLDKLHLTLFVIRLESEAEVERARVALLEATQRVTAEMRLLSSPIVLEFGGMGSFSRRVVFASIKEGLAKERLTSVADMVQSTFETHGIYSTDGRPFSPHLTIAKLSQSSGRKRVYGIDKQVYSEFMDTELGSEVVTGLELLSMVEPAATDGYYHCLQRYSFEESQSQL